MNDLRNLENFVKHFANGDLDAAQEYLSMHNRMLMNKIVNETEEKTLAAETDKDKVEEDKKKGNEKDKKPETKTDSSTTNVGKWEVKSKDNHWYVVHSESKKGKKIGPKDAKDKDYKKLAHEKAKKLNAEQK